MRVRGKSLGTCGPLMCPSLFVYSYYTAFKSRKDRMTAYNIIQDAGEDTRNPNPKGKRPRILDSDQMMFQIQLQLTSPNMPSASLSPKKRCRQSRIYERAPYPKWQGLRAILQRLVGSSQAGQDI